MTETPIASRFRRVVALLAGVIVLSASALTERAHAKTAQAPACEGKNLLAELSRTDPQTHRRVVAGGKAIANAEAILWRIEKPGLKPSYLFGTAHLPDRRLHDFPKELTEAIAAADTLALELKDFGNAAMMAEMSKLGNMLIFTDGRSLNDFLSPEEMTRVARVLAPMGVPGNVGAMFKPWVVSLFLALSPCQTQLLAQGDPSVDEALGKLAHEASVPVVGLETVREQMTSLAESDVEKQVAALRTNLKLYDRANDMTETLIQLYLQRQLPALWGLSIEMADDKERARAVFAEMKAKLIDARNQRMRNRALPLLEKGNAVIAVGALHLPDKKGLVALFRQAGYTVTAVN